MLDDSPAPVQPHAALHGLRQYVNRASVFGGRPMPASAQRTVVDPFNMEKVCDCCDVTAIEGVFSPYGATRVSLPG